MKRVHKALTEGDAANTFVREIEAGVDWAEWRGPSGDNPNLPSIIDDATKTFIWLDFDATNAMHATLLRALLNEDKFMFEQQGEDARVFDNPLELVVTISADAAVGVTNEMRTLYIMFHLWCDATGVSPADHDCYKTIAAIPNDRYYRLRGHAFFVILKSDKCPVCWEHIGPEKRRSLPVVCGCGCGRKFGVDIPNQKAWVVE